MKKSIKWFIVVIVLFIVYAGVLSMLYSIHKELAYTILSWIGAFYAGQLTARLAKWLTGYTEE